MALTYGDTRKDTLRLLDEVTSAGVVQTTADNTAKIFGFTNQAMKNLAETTAKIHGEQYIVNASVKNTLADDNSSIKTFKPGDADISVSLVNAQACYFEIIGPATVCIEEAAAGSTTYTNLETITVTSAVQSFTEYRRLITPTLATNTVRLRFTGTYVFYVRNYVLYPYTYPTAADVQQARPNFEYALPSDFLAINNVMVKKEVRQFVAYTNFILLPSRRIAFNRYDAPAEFIVNYWRMPTLFSYSGTEVTDDAQLYDIDTSGVTPTYRISDDAAMCIPYFVAGNILLSENNASMGITYLNIYETRKAEILTAPSGFTSTVLNVTGW